MNSGVTPDLEPDPNKPDDLGVIAGWLTGRIAGYADLVQGSSDACGLGSLGFDATFAERVNSDPQACPDTPP